MFATGSVVTGDVSACMANTITIEHLHLMMRVLAGSNTSARSKFARECDVVCGQYRMHIYIINMCSLPVYIQKINLFAFHSTVWYTTGL